MAPRRRSRSRCAGTVNAKPSLAKAARRQGEPDRPAGGLVPPGHHPLQGEPAGQGRIHRLGPQARSSRHHLPGLPARGRGRRHHGTGAGARCRQVPRHTERSDRAEDGTRRPHLALHGRAHAERAVACHRPLDCRTNALRGTPRAGAGPGVARAPSSHAARGCACSTGEGDLRCSFHNSMVPCAG